MHIKILSPLYNISASHNWLSIYNSCYIIRQLLYTYMCDQLFAGLNDACEL